MDHYPVDKMRLTARAPQGRALHLRPARPQPDSGEIEPPHPTFIRHAAIRRDLELLDALRANTRALHQCREALDRRGRVA